MPVETIKPAFQNGETTMVLGPRPGNIGEAIADRLAAAGHIVVKDDCWMESNWDVPSIDDITDSSPDHLVCTLGVTTLTPFDETTDESIATVLRGCLELPLKAAAHFVQASQQYRARARLTRDSEIEFMPQKIVFIGSYAHDHPLTNCAVYCAAKAGLAMATKELAWQLTSSGYRFYIVHPYHVPDTPMGLNVIDGLVRQRDMSIEEARAYQRKDLKMPDHLTRMEIAEVVHTLLSSKSFEWLSGQGLNLYGGAR